MIGYSGFECHLSRLFNRNILHLEYRLCPEHPLPAAVDDVVALYHALLRNNISPSQLMIMGDSAGGGLSLLTIQALIARQIPVPRGVIVLSPWTDLSVSGESYKRNRDIDIMFRNTNEDNGATVKLMLGPNPSGLESCNPTRPDPKPDPIRPADGCGFNIVGSGRLRAEHCRVGSVAG